MNQPPTPAATEEPEKAWIARAQAGDADAFGRLMQAHYERTYRLIWSIVRHEHDARELSQEVWLTAWQRLGTFRGEARFSTWLHPIAVRRALDHLRKRRRWYDRFLPFRDGNRDEGEAAGERVLAAPELVDPGPNARAAAETTERLAQLNHALGELPPLHRTVLALREVHGMSYEEIAHHLHCPTGTVMSRLHHARRLLARQLKDLP